MKFWVKRIFLWEKGFNGGVFLIIVFYYDYRDSGIKFFKGGFYLLLGGEGNRKCVDFCFFKEGNIYWIFLGGKIVLL